VVVDALAVESPGFASEVEEFSPQEEITNAALAKKIQFLSFITYHFEFKRAARAALHKYSSKYYARGQKIKNG
jgi:hypothetical protein